MGNNLEAFSEFLHCAQTPNKSVIYYFWKDT